MTTISPTGDTRLFAPPPEQNPRDELGQADFLKLMITQFRNQDPFKPMDNGAFLGQLAQFSTVSGIDTLNKSFATLSDTMQDEQTLQAANLIGHSVLAISDSAYLPEGGLVNGAVELFSTAQNVQVDITNAAGELVRQFNLGEQQAGIARFTWDGLDASGELVTSGHYQITARVIRGAIVESTTTLIEADIESVTLGQFGSGMMLNILGGEALSLRQVYQII